MRARNIALPGGIALPTRTLAEVPLINPQTYLSEPLRDTSLISAYLIRPPRTFWIQHPPDWLAFITRVFEKFKAGDLSRLDGLADALAGQVLSLMPDAEARLGLVIGVPLSAYKHDLGETDRVAALAREVSDRLDVPFADVLELDGNISRRMYKNAGRSSRWFSRDYRANLYVTHSPALVDCLRRGKEVLLVDDVYTDGMTTSTIATALEAEFPDMDVTVRASGGEILTLDDPRYPRLLAASKMCHAIVYCIGKIEAFTNLKRSIAIVGSRGAAAQSCDIARTTASELAREGWVIVSGMAKGIDSAAHEGALAIGGNTIAVLGCGPDVLYPPEAKELYGRINTSGLVLSEFPFGERIDTIRLKKRNKTTVALSLGVFLVESDAKGGAMNAIKASEEQDKHLHDPARLAGEEVGE